MDAIETFKNKAAQNVAGYSARKKKKEQDEFDTASNTEVDKYLKRMADETQTVKAQDATNRALQSSRQNNVKQDTTAGQALNNQIANVQAAEQARQAQIKAAQQPTAQTTPQGQLSEQARKAYVAEKNSDAWKKYYEEEKQKVRDSAFKNDGFGSWLQDVFNAGWDARLAEQNARNRYASEILNRAFDGEGNVLDKDAEALAQGVTAYNLERGRQLNEIERANTRALGASYDSDYKDNPLAAIANAIRRMDLGNAILQGDESDAAGVGKFLLNLIPGMLNAPTTGFTNISEAVTGQGLDSETGNKRDLDGLERLGRGLSGAIDAAGVFYGGSGEAISSISNQIFKRGATEAAKNVAKQTSKQVMKNFVKSMLQEGSEEAVQQAFEFFGDGGKIITKDGKFDGDAFNELVGQVAQAGALGAVGGGIFHGVSLGTDAISSNINNRLARSRNANTNLNENVNQDTNLDGDYNENLTEDVEEQAKDVRKETGTNITPHEMVNNAAQAQRVVENTDVFRDQLNDAQKQSYNELVKPVREQLEQNKISYDEYLNRIEEIQNTFAERTEQAQVQQQEESATGQQVNPNEVTAVQDAEGTQAADGVPNETNQVNTEENTTEEAEGMNQQSPTQEEQISNYQQAFEQRLAELDEFFDAETQKAIQQANLVAENGKADLSALTPAQRENYRKVLQLLSDTGALQGTVDENYNKGWLPQRLANTDYMGNGIEELINTGDLENLSLRKRTGAVAASGNMDFSNRALADLIARATLGDRVYLDSAANLAAENNIALTPEQADAVGEKIKTAVEAINKAGDSDGVIKQQDVKNIKAASEIGEAGRLAGVPQQEITQKAHGFSTYEKLADLNQWWSGYCFGVKENINAFAKMDNASVDNMIMDGFPALYKNQKEAILAKRDSIYQSKLDETNGNVKLANKLTNKALLNSAWYKNATRMAFRTNFTDANSRKVIDEAFSDYMVRNRVEKTAMQKIASVLQRVMNSAFRGLRWQTTLNEIPEIFKNVTNYGKINLVVKPSEINATLQKYGFGDGNFVEQVRSQMTPEQAVQLDADLAAVDGDMKKQVKIIKKALDGIKTGLNKADRLTQWNGFVQNIKDATFLNNAENYYRSKGLSEQQIVQRVLTDYADRMLPMDRVYKYIKSDSAISKPLQMYLDSSLRLTIQSARGAVGLDTAGIQGETNSRLRRAGRNLYTDIAPRLLTAMAIGVPIQSVFGLFTVGGDDFSGIDDEDKNTLDKILGVADDFSPLVSMITNAYYQFRQDEISKEKGYTPFDVRGDASERAAKNILKTITPLGNQVDSLFGIFGNYNSSFGDIITPALSDKEVRQYIAENNLSEKQAEEFIAKNNAKKGVQERGYGMNKSGRVTYLASDNPWDRAIGILAGENKTSAAREYNNNPDLMSSLINQAKGLDYNGDGKVDGGMLDFFRENQAVDSIINNPVFELAGLNLPSPKAKEEYNRPASDSDVSDYNAMIQNTTGAEQQEWYNKSRAYNAIKDNLRVSNPTAVEVYNTANGNDIISPQKWSIIAYANGQDADNHLVNLDTWNMMKEMAIQRSRDFGTPLNPCYELPDDRASRYLQYKSTATGEDTALTRIMKTDPFWKDFFNRQKEFYNNQGESDWDDSNATENVKAWNRLNDQMSAMYDWDNLELRQAYPAMAEYNSLKDALIANYGEDNYKSAPEYKAFFSTYGDVYNAEQEAYNEQMLLIVNQMRAIEGFDPLTPEAWDAIGDIGYSSNKSGGSSNYSYAPEFRNTFNTDPYYLSAQAKKASGFSWDKAKRPSFYAVPTSRSSGKDPYSSVV